MRLHTFHRFFKKTKTHVRAYYGSALKYFKKHQRIRAGAMIGAAIILLAEIVALTSPLFVQSTYALGKSESLLPPINQTIAAAITFDNNVFNYDPVNTGAESIATRSQASSSSVSANPRDGMTVTDTVNNVSFSMKPEFALNTGQRDGNRIVFPLSNGSGWAVYTMQSSGIKEDIILTNSNNDTQTFDYTLELGDSLEAHLEQDGSIGIYGNTLFSGNVTTGSDEDAALLQKARENAEKDSLLFSIPKPYVVDTDGLQPDIESSYELEGNHLKVIVSNLNNATYPIAIDPTIYVATAQQFMQGNNETNINFNVEDQLIEKTHTTGARFNDWTNTQTLNTSAWQQGTVAGGGYIYNIGGIHPSGGTISYTNAGSDTFVVPTDITEITVKIWGAGGGGGGGGTSGGGGDGGGGGFVETTLSVTPSESLDVYVGQRGSGGDFSSGGSGSISGDGGGGGGESAIYRSTTALASAAAGGGGGGGDNSSSTAGGAGGAGGGTTGSTGGSSSSAGGGGGGTSSSGGSGGTGGNNSGSAGSALTGGDGADGRSDQGSDGSKSNGGTVGGGDGGNGDQNANGYGAGGGGGSGWYGGGGGSGSQAGNAGGGGGGGGSSYTTGTSVTNTAGSGSTPGNSGDPSRGNAGDGGSGGSTSGSGSDGNAGKIIISYSGDDTEALDTVNWARLNTATGTVDSANPGIGVCSGWCTSSDYKLPETRSSFSTVLYSGFLYVIGGESDSCTTGNGTGEDGVCDTVYVAKIGANGEPQLWHPTDTDPGNWEYWYRDTDLSSPRSHLSAIANNNRIYLLGGVTSSGGSASTTNKTEIADINPTGKLNNWTTSSNNLPYNVYGHDSQVYNDRLYLIGGASSIGGAPLSSVYYTKINSDGTINSWQQTTSFSEGRMSNGGNFSTVWGGYIYISGGCNAVNGSGYCTDVDDSTQLASINADGTIDKWNTNASVTDSRMGHNTLSWRNYIYIVGGCTAQDSGDGSCTGALDTIRYGEINQDGDASTVDQSVGSGTSPCTGGSPENCDLPSSSIGNVLNGTAIINGMLYVMGGCTNNACTSVSDGVAYVAIDSDGSLVRPSSCSGSYDDSYCVSTNSLPSDVAAPGVTTFNGRIYVVGGFPSVNNVYYTSVDPQDGSLSSWSSATLSSIGATNVSYTYAYSRANPSSAGSVPGNLYILGGCTSPSSVGCSSYTDNVYKCNISTSGVPSSCSTSGQLQIGTIPGASSSGIGAHAGTVYANYIYLIGGLAPNLTDMDTVRYAEFDDSNNIVAVSGSSWIESENTTSTGRRRGAAFGYNGYLYVTGGYDGTGGGGVLADIEFSKIDVTDGSIESFSISAVTINQRWGLSVPVSNSYAYVIGGCTVGAAPSSCTSRTDTIQTFQIYNNDSGAPAEYSTSANSYATGRYGAGSAVLNGYMYVAGGCISLDDCSDATNSVQYAPIDVYGNVGTWSAATNLPADRAWGQLEAAGGSLYYIGGQDDTATNEQSTVYYGTPSSGNISSWSTASNGLPGARTQFSSAVWNDRIYVSGGLDGSANTTNTVYVSPQLSSGGNITSAWASDSDTFDVSRSGHTLIAYANNLYTLGGSDGSNYLNDVQFTQINSDGTLDPWTFSTSLPQSIQQADGFARNGYLYLIGGRSASAVCESSTLVAPISANTTIASGNNPTGVGVWFETNQKYSGNRYGANALYHDGKAYLLGGIDCNNPTSTTYSSAGSSTYTVPSGVTSITVKIWGAGGGGGGGGTSGGGGDGGGGGFVETTLSVTPSESLDVYVGQHGSGGDFSSGGSGSNSGDGGGGGGESAIYRSTTALASAAAGGGGGGGDNSSSTAGGAGGAGGGTTGSTGGSSSSAGGGNGGTASSGGSGGTGGNNSGSAGSALTGGDGADGRNGQGNDGSKSNGGTVGGGDGGNGDQNTNGFAAGGGGGSGWYGGGGGSGSLSGDAGGGGGGGGSSYTTGTSVTNTAGSGSTPGNSGDPSRGNAGDGGSGGSTSGSGSDGQDGKVIISYAGSFTAASPAVQQTTLLSQPQLARYSVQIDTDSDVFPTDWLLNGVDNSTGAKWQLTYRSMTNTTTFCTSPAMTTWGQDTNFGDVTLGLPGVYTPINGSGTNTDCARYYYFSVGVDSTQAYGYPDDVSRGPTITDLTLQFTADPAKRLLHGRTFTGGLQQPIDTPYYSN